MEQLNQARERARQEELRLKTLVSVDVHFYMPMLDPDTGERVQHLLPRRRGQGDYTHIVVDGQIYVEWVEKNITLKRGDLGALEPDVVYWHPDSPHDPKFDPHLPLFQHEDIAELWSNLTKSAAPGVKITRVQELPPDEGFNRLDVENRESARHGYMYSKYAPAPVTPDGWIVPASSMHNRGDLAITDACWYDIIINQYAPQFRKLQHPTNGSDRPRYPDFRCTYQGLWEIFHPGAPYDATKLGLSIAEAHKFFRMFHVPLHVLDCDHKIDRAASFVVPKPKRNQHLSVCWVIQHNNHVYPASHGRKCLEQLLPTLPETVLNLQQQLVPVNVDDEVKPLTARVFIPTKAVDVQFAETIDELVTLDMTGDDERLHVKCPVNMQELLRVLLATYSYEPKITLRAGEIVSLQLRLQSGDSEPKDVVIAPPDMPPGEAAPIIADEETFKLYSHHDQALRNALMNENTKNTYSKSALEAYQNHSRGPLIHGHPDAAACADVVASDMNKAHTAMVLQMKTLPVFNSFDEFEEVKPSLKARLFAQQPVSEREENSEYQVEVTGQIEPLTPLGILLDKPVNIVCYGSLHLAIELSAGHPPFKVTAIKMPSRVVSVGAAVNKAIEDLWASSLPVPLKKFIPNKNVGVSGRRYNTREVTYTFQAANEAHAYQKAVGGRFLMRTVGGRKLFFVHKAERAELVDGFYPIQHRVNDGMRVAAALRVMAMSLPFIGIKTDCVYLQGSAEEVPKKHNFESIGMWSVSAAGKVPLPRREGPIHPAIKPWVPQPPTQLGITDEFDAKEFAVHFNAHNRVLVKATIPGAGKTFAAVQYLKEHHPGRGVIVTPYNALCVDFKIQGIPAITCHDLLGVRVTDDKKEEQKKQFDVTNVDVVVFDEVFCYDTKMLQRIRDWMDANPSIKIIAAGDAQQLLPIEFLCMKDSAKMDYYGRIVDRLFPSQITLQVCKRVSNDVDRLRMTKIRDTIWDKRQLLQTRKQTVLQGFPQLNTIKEAMKVLADGGIAVCGPNTTMDYINTEAHKQQVVAGQVVKCKGREFYVGQTLRCRHYTRAGSKALRVNFLYTVTAVNEKDIKLKDVNCDDEITMNTPVAASSLTYCFAWTCHSLQGTSKSVPLVLFDTDNYMVDDHWIYTALTTSRDLNQLYVYNGPLPFEVCSEASMRKKVESLIAGYKTQDAAAHRSYENADYVTCDQVMEMGTESSWRCAICGDTLATCGDEAISVDRLDNTMAHVFDNVQLAHLSCNKAKGSHDAKH